MSLSNNMRSLTISSVNLLIIIHAKIIRITITQSNKLISIKLHRVLSLRFILFITVTDPLAKIVICHKGYEYKCYYVLPTSFAISTKNSSRISSLECNS